MTNTAKHFMGSLHVALIIICLSHEVFSRVCFNDTEIDRYWEEYKELYDKKYTEDEEPIRKEAWVHNLEDITRHNIEHSLGHFTYTRSLTELADRYFYDPSPNFIKSKGSGLGTQIETAATTRRPPVFNTNYNPRLLHYEYRASNGSSIDIPYLVDWREEGLVTRVKNQGYCNACWAFAATGALEGQMKKKYGELVDLSEQNLIDCAAGNTSCYGGWMGTAYEYVQRYGLDTEISYPYSGKINDKCNQQQGYNYGRCRGYKRIPYGDETELAFAVATIGPISATIDGSLNTFRTYKYGIFEDPNCRRNYYSHAVLIVGYGTENGMDYWLVKNSYGLSWGDQGYMKIARNRYNMCGIASGASYPLV